MAEQGHIPFMLFLMKVGRRAANTDGEGPRLFVLLW
jgi:hypothetical protein